MMKKSERNIHYAIDILLNDKDEHARYRAAWAFDRAVQYSDLDVSQAIDALKEAFYADESSGVRFYAASAIRRGRIQKKTEEKAKAMVEEALESEILAIRSTMAAVLLINNAYRDPDVEKLLGIIKEGLSDKNARSYMAEAVQAVAERTSLIALPIPELVGLLVHKNGHTKESAAKALRAIRKNGTEILVNKGNIAIFEHALNDDVYEVRVAAAEILLSVSKKARINLLAPLVPKLLLIIYSPNEGMSSNAVYTLFHLAEGDEKIKRMVVPEFLRALELVARSDPKSDLKKLRKTIIDALRFGLDAESKVLFIPHLANAIFDEDWEVRRDTIGILERIIKACKSISDLDQIKIHVRESAIAHKDSELFGQMKNTCLSLLAKINARKNFLIAIDIRVDKKILRLNRRDSETHRMQRRIAVM